MATEKRKSSTTRRKKNVTEEPKQESTFLADMHRIPSSLNYMSEVTVYACSLGNKGYRFNTNLTKLNSCLVWKKTMSGIEAVRFLKEIKARNRQGKLESFQLPD